MTRSRGFSLSEQASVLRLAYVLTGDGGLAEDVVADAFAAMYPRWKSGKVDDPVAYLRRAVVNQIRGRFRRNTTRPQVRTETRRTERVTCRQRHRRRRPRRGAHRVARAPGRPAGGCRVAVPRGSLRSRHRGDAGRLRRHRQVASRARPRSPARRAHRS